MSLTEIAIVIGITLAAIGGYAAYQNQAAEQAQAEIVAAVLSDVHQATEEYIRQQAPTLEQCFNSPEIVADWVSNTDGGQATPFVPIPLFRFNPPSRVSYSAARHFQPPSLGPTPPTYFSTANFPYCLTPLAVDRTPTMADLGLLPGSLSGLTYSTSPVSHLWGREQLDIRAAVRFVNFNREPGRPLSLGYQALVVLRTPLGIPMSLSLARKVAVASALPETGLLASSLPGVLVPVNSIRGALGGWILNVCDTATPSADCGVEPPFADLPFLASGGETFSAMLVRAPTESRTGEFAGWDGDPTARIFTLVTSSRRTALSDVLYSRDIGVPGANRMHVPLDMGGFGFANVRYIPGVDQDGDGQIDRSPHIIGADAGTDSPIVLHGDVLILGGLQIGARPGGVPTEVDAAGTPVIPPEQNAFSDSIRPGDLWTRGALMVGANPEVDVFFEPDAADLPDPGSVLITAATQLGLRPLGTDIDADGTADPPNFFTDHAAAGDLWVRRALMTGIGNAGARTADYFHNGPTTPSSPGMVLFTHGLQLGSRPVNADIDGSGAADPPQPVADPAALTAGSIWVRNSSTFGHARRGTGDRPRQDEAGMAVGDVLVQGRTQLGLRSNTPNDPFFMTAPGVPSTPVAEVGDLLVAGAAQFGLDNTAIGSFESGPLDSGDVWIKGRTQFGSLAGTTRRFGSRDPGLGAVNLARGDVFMRSRLQVGGPFSVYRDSVAAASPGTAVIRSALQLGVEDTTIAGLVEATSFVGNPRGDIRILGRFQTGLYADPSSQGQTALITSTIQRPGDGRFGGDQVEFASDAQFWKALHAAGSSVFLSPTGTDYEDPTVYELAITAAAGALKTSADARGITGGNHPFPGPPGSPTNFRTMSTRGHLALGLFAFDFPGSEPEPAPFPSQPRHPGCRGAFARHSCPTRARDARPGRRVPLPEQLAGHRDASDVPRSCPATLHPARPLLGGDDPGPGWRGGGSLPARRRFGCSA